MRRTTGATARCMTSKCALAVLDLLYRRYLSLGCLVNYLRGRKIPVAHLSGAPAAGSPAHAAPAYSRVLTLSPLARDIFLLPVR